jgi:hypothetical protein
VDAIAEAPGHLDRQPDLVPDFSDCGLLRRLARLDVAARARPGGRAVPELSVHHQELAVLDDVARSHVRAAISGGLHSADGTRLVQCALARSRVTAGD